MNSNVERQLTQLRKAVKRRQDAQDVIHALDVKKHIAPVYYALHDDIQQAQHQYYNLPGGRGSGKSSFCALEIVSGIMQDETGASNAIVFRRTANTMRESVYSQIQWAIDALDVGGFWQGSVSPMRYTYLPTGAQIIFRGLDDSSKLKSIKPTHGTFRFVWFEEFSELPGENFTRNVLQSVVRGGNSFTVFRSFNPPMSRSNWANLFVEQPDPRAITLRTTYLDIPAAWLGESFIYEAERLREINETAYSHEYMGEPTGTGGEVFPNITVRRITDEEKETVSQYLYAGIDWGFSVDPAVFISVAFDRKRDTVYLLDEIYKKHCGNKELANLIKAKDLDKPLKKSFVSIFDGRQYEARQTIFADSAEPKSINDLISEGLLVRACKKYAGSVLYGIKWLQNRHIVIDPQRTPNAHREFINYQYMTSKDGEFLADVPDKDNHTIDATRYALDQLINQRGISA